MGGLHAFTRWSGPILTDSGGFQVFSLPSKEISDRGVRFKNELDGSVLELTPERSIEIQNGLGADVIMAFDECTPYPASEKLAADGVRRTLASLRRGPVWGVPGGTHSREHGARRLGSYTSPGRVP